MTQEWTIPRENKIQVRGVTAVKAPSLWAAVGSVHAGQADISGRFVIGRISTFSLALKELPDRSYQLAPRSPRARLAHTNSSVPHLTAQSPWGSFAGSGTHSDTPLHELPTGEAG